MGFASFNEKHIDAEVRELSRDRTSGTSKLSQSVFPKKTTCFEAGCFFSGDSTTLVFSLIPPLEQTIPPAIIAKFYGIQ